MQKVTKAVKGILNNSTAKNARHLAWLGWSCYDTEEKYLFKYQYS